MLWPKTLIRLHDTSGSAASQQGKKVTPPASAGAHDHLEHLTEDVDHNALNIDQAPIDEFIDQLGMDHDPHDSPNPDELRAGKFECLKNLFSSQETLEEAAAFTAPLIL